MPECQEDNDANEDVKDEATLPGHAAYMHLIRATQAERRHMPVGIKDAPFVVEDVPGQPSRVYS